MITKLKGFTLPEVLLIIALFAVLVGISAPIYGNFQSDNNLSTSRALLASEIRQTQQYATSGRLDDNWSIYFSGNSMTIFKGDVYASRDTTHDEITQLPSGIQFSSNTQFTFERVSANIISGNSVSISDGTKNETITLNSYGALEF